MTNSHGYVLEYPRVRVDHFDQAPVPLPASLLAHRRSIGAPISNCTSTGANGLKQECFDKPLLYLLTHIHTDHLKGLERPGLTAPIYCSLVTKNLLLRYERQKTRIEKDRESDSQNNHGVVRPYAHLYVSERHASAKSTSMGFKAAPLDLLRPLPYNTPTRIQYTPKKFIMLTLIESNHMFGGTMFLIQGEAGAVLHTGDMRAETWWCDALLRNPVLSQYVSWSHSTGPACDSQKWPEYVESLDSESKMSSMDHEEEESMESNATAMSSVRSSLPNRKGATHLENIYLDTELLLCNQEVPSKQQACQDMIALMRLYPSDTVFFLNAWTWGYEDMLIATAKGFGSKIHVDRFKHGMFKAAKSEMPFLSDIVTSDESKTRFHACEKLNMCETLCQLATRPVLSQRTQNSLDGSPDDRTKQHKPLLVYVNPGQVALERWPEMFADTAERLRSAELGKGAWPEALIVPIERHSTLPELQDFVKLFRPRTVSPNTILDVKGGLDYYLLHHLFGHLLHEASDQQEMAKEGLALLGEKTWAFYEAQIALARSEAVRDAGDSTEALLGISSSLGGSAHSGEASLDAAQLSRLCRIRGLSFKSIIMHNMAGKLAAMLEVERWTRAEDNLDKDSMSLLPDSLGSSKDMSVSSANYDADHSQVAETQAPPAARAVPQPAEDSRDDIPRASVCEEFADTGMQTQSQLSTQSVDEGKTILTDDLANRYLNVLIHYFRVPFDRSSTKASYIEMWNAVRASIPDDAQKVEEHWFRENGVLPPLWPAASAGQPESSAHTEAEQQRDKEEPKGAPTETHDPDSLDENGIAEAAAKLAAFVDMMDPTSAQSGKALLAPSRVDRAIALRLVLKHLRYLGFDPLSGASSAPDVIGGNCSGNPTLWSAMEPAITRLASMLQIELAAITNRIVKSSALPSHEPHHAPVKQQVSELAIQVVGVLFGFRTLNGLIDIDISQTLLSLLLIIIEKSPKVRDGASKEQRRLVELACAALRREELPEAIIGPLEPRLMALAADPEGPLRQSLISSDEDSAYAATKPTPPVEQVVLPLALTTTTDHTLHDISLEDPDTSAQALVTDHVSASASENVPQSSIDQHSVDSFETFEASSLQIRQPIPAVQPPAIETVRRHIPRVIVPLREQLHATLPQNGASQESSVTQDEDFTTEEESLASVVAVPEATVESLSRTRKERKAVPLSSIAKLHRPPIGTPAHSLKRVNSDGATSIEPARPTRRMQRSTSLRALNSDRLPPSRTRGMVWPK